jgi:hypothetical protein
MFTQNCKLISRKYSPSNTDDENVGLASLLDAG